MKRVPIALSLIALLAGAAVAVAAPKKSKKRVAPPVAANPNAKVYTPEEARLAVAILDDAYSELLHEVHSTYGVKAGKPVAASILRDVQKQMSEKGWPSSRYLAVNALAMNPNHMPKDEWERHTVAQMKSGKNRLEQEKPGELRVATVTMLTGDCARCHWTKDSGGPRAAISWRVPISSASKGAPAE